MKRILKFAYRLIPFKKQLFLFLKLFWRPPKKIYQHLHFNGDFKVRIDKSHYFKIKHFGYEIENDIFWRGLTDGWEKISIRLWIQLCKQSEVIFDIGANTGLYALTAKAVNPSAKVYAFEPVHRVYDKLAQNIILNNSDTVAVNIAASNSNGVAKIYDTEHGHVLSVCVNQNLLPPDVNVNEVQIEIITLDSFINQNNIQKIDAMKIDVETHEPEVLEGFKEHLSRFRPALIIEILSDEIGEKVMRLTEGLNYLYFNIDDLKGTVRQVNNVSKSDYFNYLLCSEQTAKELNLIYTQENVMSM
jgi:FkbM family methyltransferase